MAKKLSLRLNYKGKFLDYAKEGVDFKNRFFIGSNKYLQWQILENSFPDKHLFITKKGSDYVMQLLPNTQLNCMKDGSPVDANYLKQNGILKGNELVLKPNMSGNLDISADWQVNYEFREPWVTVLTAEERQIVAQYARKAQADPADRFNRMLLIIGTVLALLIILILDLTMKPTVTFDDTIEGKLAAIRTEAQKVQADLTDNASSFTESEAEAAKEEAKPEVATDAKGTPGDGAQAPPGAKGLSSMLGNFDASAVDPKANASFKIVTVAEGFTATKRGSGPGGGGPGSGPGGSGPGSGGGASFDASERVGFGTGRAAIKGPGTAGYDDRPVGGVGEHITGDASKVAVTGVAFGDLKKMAAIAAQFKRQGIATVKESEIAALSEAQRQDYADLKDQVKAKSGQIDAAFRQAGSGFNASFDVIIRISSSGAVQSAEVIPKSPGIPESFVAKVQSIIERWSFNVKEAKGYQFSIRLRKG